MIPCVLGQQGFLAVVRWVGVFHEHLSFKCGDSEVVPPFPVSPGLSTVLSVRQVPVCLPHEGSWLGCQDLCAKRAVSIGELVANSGSSWMSLLPNLHFATQLLKRVLDQAAHFGHESLD